MIRYRLLIPKMSDMDLNGIGKELYDEYDCTGIVYDFEDDRGLAIDFDISPTPYQMFKLKSKYVIERIEK